MTVDHLIVYEPGMVALAESLLPTQFRDSPRIVAAIRAMASAAQWLEDLSFEVLVGLGDFEAAPADLLEKQGRLIGEVRGALSREDYLRFVELRILVNVAGAADRPISLPTFTALLVAAYAPSAVRLSIEVDLMRVTIDSTGGFLDESIAEHATDLVRSITPLGTLVVVSEGVEGQTFRLDTGPGLDVGQFGRQLHDGRRNGQ